MHDVPPRSLVLRDTHPHRAWLFLSKYTHRARLFLDAHAWRIRTLHLHSIQSFTFYDGLLKHIKQGWKLKLEIWKQWWNWFKKKQESWDVTVITAIVLHFSSYCFWLDSFFLPSFFYIKLCGGCPGRIAVLCPAHYHRWSHIRYGPDQRGHCEREYRSHWKKNV